MRGIGHEHEISISTTHLVKHSICKNLGASRKKPKIGPYRKPPQKSTSAVNLKVAVIMKKVNPSSQREMATQLGCLSQPFTAF